MKIIPFPSKSNHEQVLAILQRAKENLEPFRDKVPHIDDIIWDIALSYAAVERDLENLTEKGN